MWSYRGDERIAYISPAGLDAMRRLEPGPLFVSNRNDELRETIASRTCGLLERVGLVVSFMDYDVAARHHYRKAKLTEAGRFVLGEYLRSESPRIDRNRRGSSPVAG